MSAFLDRYHDAFHNGTNVDLINCPHCQDEFIAWQEGAGELPPASDVFVPDRLEDMEV